MTLADVIATPPGVDPLDLLWGAQHTAWRTESGYRVWVTRDDPVLFAYTYLIEHLSSAETGGVISFARHHLVMAARGARWAAPGRHRDLVIAPRGSAKSTWAVVLILWALAHGHRRLALCLGLSDRDIGIHMDTIRAELGDNHVLLTDFPHLRPGRRNNSGLVITRGGAAVACRGLDAGALGLKVESQRPDLLWLDDVEPDEGAYSLDQVPKRLGTVLGKVLPMNDQAVALWTGTVTMYGSILHAVVRGDVGEQPMPGWIIDGGWKVHYSPALQVDGRGREASYWQQRHPLAYLRSISHTYDYALNYQGRPPLPGGKMWRENMFRHLAEPVQLVERAIWVDVAVSGASLKARHDYTAVCIAGRPVGVRDRAVIEYARAWRMTGGQLLALLHELCEARPDIRTVHLEKNQGGELWREILSPMPTGVTLELESASEPKLTRIRRGLRRYERDQVIHANRLAELEEKMTRYPGVEHDDLVDVASTAVVALLPEP